MKVCGKDILIQGRVIRIARLAAETYEFLSDPDEPLAALKACGRRIDLFTFTQQLPDISPRYGHPMELDNLAAVPISTFEHWWKHQINGKTRNMIRRAESKGITVREVPFDDALVHGIKAIYDESPVRQGRSFWHYMKDVESVRRENVTFLDRSVFLGAFLDGTLIGFAKLVGDGQGRQAALMQILSMIRHRDKAPTNALVAESVRACAERGTGYLVYSHFAYGRKDRDGLSDFKQHNGFQRIDLPRYYVPFTALGRLASVATAPRRRQSRARADADASPQDARPVGRFDHFGLRFPSSCLESSA
jgi:hypothetical protein